METSSFHGLEALPEHRQTSELPADHVKARTDRITSRIHQERGQSRLVLPHAAGRGFVDVNGRGDDGVGKLLQRPRRRNPVNIYYSTGQRRHRENRIPFGRSPFSGRRLAGGRLDRHAAGQPRQSGSLPARAPRWHTIPRKMRSTHAAATATALGTRCTG